MRRAGLVELVDDPRQADWLVRLDQGKVELVEASGNRAPFPLPSPDNPALGEALRQSLEKVYRARNLVALSSRFEAERDRGSPAVDVEVEVLRHKDRAAPGEVLPAPAGGWVFRPGDLISFRIHNKSPAMRVDVTLLIVGSDFEIQPFYPQARRGGQEPGSRGDADDPAAAGRDQRGPALRPGVPGGHRGPGEQPAGGLHGPGAGRSSARPGCRPRTRASGRRWGNCWSPRCFGPAPAAG